MDEFDITEVAHSIEFNTDHDEFSYFRRVESDDDVVWVGVREDTSIPIVFDEEEDIYQQLEERYQDQ